MCFKKGKPDDAYLKRVEWEDDRMNKPWNNPYQPPPASRNEKPIDFLRIYRTIVNLFGGKKK